MALKTYFDLKPFFLLLKMKRRSVSITLLRLGLLAASAVSNPAARSPIRYSAYDAQVDALLSRMTLDEKVGQMTQADQEALQEPRDIEKYYLGSVLNGGNSDPKAGNTLANWTEMYLAYQTHALKTRLGIPLLYGVDAVHGHNNVLGAVIFPHNIGLGCTRNPRIVEQAAQITAEEVRATGINWVFAPCVAVAPMKASASLRTWSRLWLDQRSAASKEKICAGPTRLWLARSISWGMAVQRLVPVRRREKVESGGPWTAATPSWTKKPCAAYICRGILPRFSRGWARLCRRLAVGTV